MRNCFSSYCIWSAPIEEVIRADTHIELFVCHDANISKNPTFSALALTILIVMELLQEDQKFVLVPPQDANNLWRLVRIRNEHLVRHEYYLKHFRSPTLKT